jgi:hypothetical protein
MEKQKCTDIVSMSLEEKWELCQTAATSLTDMFRSVYKKFGEEGKELIKEQFLDWSNDFVEKNPHLRGKPIKEILEPFIRHVVAWGGGQYEILEDTDDRFIYRIHKCPHRMGFSKEDIEICDALMSFDRNFAERFGLKWKFLRRRTPENDSCDKFFSKV